MTKQHADFAPSAADRWLRCPGSVELSKGIDEGPKPAAEEGTRLHKIADDLLMWRRAVADADPEDLKILEPYLNHCQDLIEQNDVLPSIWKSEMSVPLWYEPGQSGTSDFVAWNNETRTLHVVDLKTGRLAVDPDCPQLRIYAIGAITKLNIWQKVREVVLTIIQPPISSQPQRYMIPVVELTELSSEIGQLMKENLDRRTPGEVQCQWCPAKLICPERNAEVRRVLQQSFELEIDKRVDLELIGDLLNNRALIRAAIDDAEAFALENIEEFPEFEIGATSKHRQWADEEELIERCEEAGVNPYAEPKFKTPAKLLTSKALRDKLGELAFQPTGDPKLVRKKQPKT